MTSVERHEIRYQRRKARREEKRKQYQKYNDFDWVFSYKHLYKAYRKCCRNVGWKASTQIYKSTALIKIYRTMIKLKRGTYRSKGFFEFDIIERGKKRHIKSVIIDERIVQRCLCDYCLVPLLSKSFIYDNGASIKNKGYNFARKRITQFLRKHARKYGREGYVFLYDFSKFFDNISHALCKRIIRKVVTDERLIKLIDHFIDMFGDIGLGLGSQVSQILALASANELDHMIKDVLSVKAYERYMDDGSLIHKSKTYLEWCKRRFASMCRRLSIVVNIKKTLIAKLSRGFTWLKTKFYILDSGRILKKPLRENITKRKRSLRSYRVKVNERLMSVDDAYMSFQSWRSYIKGFDAHRSLRTVTELFNELFPEYGGI